MTEAAPDHSTLSRTRRRIDVETHEAVFTWVLERVSEAGLVRGRRSASTRRRWKRTRRCGASSVGTRGNRTRRSCGGWRRHRDRDAYAGGVGAFRRSRKDKKTSNKEWRSPQDPDAKVAKMKDGRTHLAHKVEQGVDMETGAILSVTVQDASAGDTATLAGTLTMASEQVEAVQPEGAGSRRWWPTRGTTATRRWWSSTSLGFGATSRSRSGDRAAGRTSGRERRRRRSVLRRRRCMGTVGVIVATEVVDCNDGAGSWWSGPSRTSM